MLPAEGDRLEPKDQVLTTARRGGAPAVWRGAEVIEKPFDLAEVVRLVGEAIPVGSSI